MLICMFAGFGYAWSVFQIPFINKFNWTTSQVSMTFTLSILSTALVPGFVGKMLSYIKTQYVVIIGCLVFGISVMNTGSAQTLPHLYLSGGVGTGLGIGILYPCITGCSVRIFPDKRGLVAGLLAASYGSGAIIWAPIAVRLIESYGLKTTYQILGFAFLIIIFALSFGIKEDSLPKTVNDRKSYVENSNKSIKDKNWKEMLKSPKYYVIIGIFAIGSTSGLMIIGHASPIVQETLKVSSGTAAIVVGILAITNTIGRLFWGWLSDQIGRYRTIIILFVIVGSAMLGLASSSQFIVFVIMILSIGFCYGGFAALMAPLTADLFGVKYLSENYGFVYFAYGFGGVIGPRLAATIKDMNNGNYTWAFIIAAALSIIGIAVTIFASRSKKEHQLSI